MLPATREGNTNKEALATLVRQKATLRAEAEEWIDLLCELHWDLRSHLQTRPPTLREVTTAGPIL